MLTRFEQDGIEVFINEITGEAFANQNAIARMSGITKQAINQHLAAKGVNLKGVKTLEVPTHRGFQVSSLFNEDAIEQILYYYAFESKAANQTAKQNYRSLAKAGARLFLYGLAGYQIKLEQRKPAKSNPNYLPARKGCFDEVKRCGGDKAPFVFPSLEKYNNRLADIPDGARNSLTELEAYKVIVNYQSAQIELQKRDSNFAKHPNHLLNAAKMGMRQGVYAIAGTDAVPKQLKPKREQ